MQRNTIRLLSFCGDETSHREISMNAIDVMSHASLAEFQEIEFDADSRRREKLSPEEIYPRNRRDLRPVSHRYDISKEQVSPVFCYAFQMNHRVFRVHKNDYLELVSSSAGIDYTGCYALSLNCELSDNYLKFPESWLELKERDHYGDLITELFDLLVSKLIFLYIAN